MKKNNYSINLIGRIFCFFLLAFFSFQSNAYSAASSYYDTVQKIFIGYYQRPADPGGLIYWADRLDKSGGNLSEIIEAFANSEESRSLYGTINSGTITTVVNSIYITLFGRPAEAEGLNWYVNGFNAGTYTAATIMLNVLSGAQNEDLQSVNNKLAAANLFTRTIDPDLNGSNFQATYTGDGDVIAGRNFIALVTSNSTTVPTKGQTYGYISYNIANPGDVIGVGGTNTGKMEIYVKASKEDMIQRNYYVEFRESVNGGTNRKLKIFSQGRLSSYIKPYINDPAGTWEINTSSDEITFNFNNQGQVSYGYKIQPMSTISGSGYCNKDIAVFAMYSSFPNAILYDSSLRDISLIYDIPEDMVLYASSWPNFSDRIMKIKDNGINKIKYATEIAAWGNFSNIETKKYDDHTFYMLGYNTNIDKNFALTRFTYNYFMKAFNGNYSFLSPSNLYIVLPNDEGYWGPAGEGYGGSYFRNDVGESLVPIFRTQELACDAWNGGYEYFRFLINGNALTVAPVHMIAHATLTNYIGDWWPSEGIAVYYQIKILEKYGVLSVSEAKREFMSHIKCYQSVIVGSKDDYALLNFKSFVHGDYISCMIAYKKGALVFYILDELIKKYTNGNSELIDLFTLVFNGFKYSKYNGYDNFIQKINQLTGRDFSEFFARFVYTSEPLPLKIEGNEILLTYFPPQK